MPHDTAPPAAVLLLLKMLKDLSGGDKGKKLKDSKTTKISQRGEICKWRDCV